MTVRISVHRLSRDVRRAVTFPLSSRGLTEPTLPVPAGRTIDIDAWTKVRIKDAKGLKSETTKSVLVDDWTQMMGRRDNGDGTGTVRGSQYTADSTVPVYAVTTPYTLRPGDVSGRVAIYVGTGRTDSDGDVLPFDVPNPNPNGGSYLVGDYDHRDNIYEPERDGVSFSNIPNVGRPGR